MKVPDEDWLLRINREFRQKDIDVRRRPILALERYCRDFRVIGLPIDSMPARKIFDWFYENTKPEAHHVGSLYSGAYYYDSCFWAVDIPLGYGQFCLDALESLRGMSDELKSELMLSPNDAWNYVLFWVDCIDYGYGFDDLSVGVYGSEFGLKLLRNADRELKAATAQLLEHRPNPKAAMSSRMAVELYLKAFLVLKGNYSDAEVRRFSHRLPDLVDECGHLVPGHDVTKVREELSLFPAIHERYTGESMPNQKLFAAYCIAQYCGASVIRSFTDRDTRDQIQQSFKQE